MFSSVSVFGLHAKIQDNGILHLNSGSNVVLAYFSISPDGCRDDEYGDVYNKFVDLLSTLTVVQRISDCPMFILITLPEMRVSSTTGFQTLS